MLASCNRNKFYEKNYKMTDNKWPKLQELTFEVPITDTAGYYDVVLNLRHTEYYAYANIIIGVNIITPNGEERYKHFDLMIKNPDNTFKGDGSGDIWDYSKIIYEKLSFNTTGTYKFVMSNHMPLIETEGIMEVGLSVEKSKD